ncbi:MAG: hypothetical protein IKY23_12380 [Lachnospiraceae bacterium]|nr:hypothetical protein [Lachnospiraceae bacterium]
MASVYRVGSFNIQKFGRKSMLKKDIKGIADIIKSNKLDIVAIQEISNKEALKEIMKCLDGTIISEGIPGNSNARDVFSCETSNWEGRWAKPISYIGGKNAEEGYAFIWLKRRIELPVNKYRKKSEPDIYLIGGKTIRPPFCGRFLVKSCNAEIRLINTHIIFRKNPIEDADMEEEESTATDYEERLKEYRVLANEIYQRVYIKNIGTRQVVTFILGDYNMCLQESNSLDKKAIMPLDVERLKYGRHIIKTIQNQKTTIRGKSRKNPEMIYCGEENLANNYDHFSYEEKLENSLVIHSRRLDAECLYRGKYQDIRDVNGNNMRNEYEAYRTLISDHLPIMMSIAFTKR